mmetsp:Transcript_15958/g.37634  ORF Transcript_15958/g.37634 Transcript_15958/m.37634 type:complete len:131 (+) Transcript_15958:1-393(+)
MRRECCFYQLPDGVTIKRENIAASLMEINAEFKAAKKKKARKDAGHARHRCLASEIFCQLLEQQGLQTYGVSSVSINEFRKTSLVVPWSQSEHPELLRQVVEMAKEYGWTVASLDWQSFQLKFEKATLPK